MLSLEVTGLFITLGDAIDFADWGDNRLTVSIRSVRIKAQPVFGSNLCAVEGVLKMHERWVEGKIEAGLARLYYGCVLVELYSCLFVRKVIFPFQDASGRLQFVPACTIFESPKHRSVWSLDYIKSG